MSIYLDYNATSPVDNRVIEVMVDVYRNHIGNSDSRTHDFGNDARSIIETARGEVASLINVKKDEVIFTSGATESNNIAVLGLREYALNANRKHIIISSIEHKAILEAIKHLENSMFDIDYLDPDERGVISLEDFKRKLRKDTLLVSVMHVNNETGIIQPVKEIGEYLKDTDTLFHIDATQSVGKLVEEVRNLNYDMMTISAHKMHGPQGVGALILKKKRYKYPPVKSIMYGGQQEHGIRPGTLPTALIAGFGKACSIAEFEYRNNYRACLDIKNDLLELLVESGVDYEINGSVEISMPNTLNISFIGVASEALMLASKQYCGVSNGAACNSTKYSSSYVLKSMGLSEDRINSAIRISWDSSINPNLLREEFNNLLSIVKLFR